MHLGLLKYVPNDKAVRDDTRFCRFEVESSTAHVKDILCCSISYTSILSIDLLYTWYQ